jgi:electron transfer flavoprotein alpha subunit
MTRRFWVFIEQEQGTMHPVVGELLGVARRLVEEISDELAESGDEAVVEGVLVGCEVEHVAQEAIQHGAGRVYMVDDPGLNTISIAPTLKPSPIW